MQDAQRLVPGGEHRHRDLAQHEGAGLPRGVRRQPGAGDRPRAGDPAGDAEETHAPRLSHGRHNGPMAALKDRLRTDLTASMKARDEIRSSTLRMVLTAITNAEVAGKEARELTDEDVLTVLASESKKRREAATAFADGGRAEMAAKEEAEAAVIADYLPEPLSDAEVVAIVSAAIEQTGAAGEGMRAMGKVMGVVQPQVKGRADGSAVAAEVRRQLG